MPSPETHHTGSRIRTILEAGRVPLGLQCFSGSPALIEIAGYSGFDFVMIDTEHANIDAAQVEHLVRAAESAAIEPIVRVAANDPVLIRHALEAGARGVIIPQVRTAAEVELALRAAKYPPSGTRGMCPATRAARYSIAGWDAYANETNEQVLVIPLLEHPEAINNAETICALDGVDVVLFGPADLGMALGVGGRGMAEPRVQEAFDHLLAIAAVHHTAVMAVPFPDLSAEACQRLLDRGVNILLHSVDELLFAEVCRTIVTDLRPTLNVTHRPVHAAT